MTSVLSLTFLVLVLVSLASVLSHHSTRGISTPLLLSFRHTYNMYIYVTRNRETMKYIYMSTLFSILSLGSVSHAQLYLVIKHLYL